MVGSGSTCSNARQSTKVFFRPLLVPHLLTSHWPNKLHGSSQYCKNTLQKGCTQTCYSKRSTTEWIVALACGRVLKETLSLLDWEAQVPGERARQLRWWLALTGGVAGRTVTHLHSHTKYQPQTGVGMPGSHLPPQWHSTCRLSFSSLSIWSMLTKKVLPSFSLCFSNHKWGHFLMFRCHLYWVVIAFNELPIYVLRPFFFEILLF